ncbi:MAG: hypothetical protein JWQ71_1019 [Pedosphaera sp.]|nr:hypothetical protein [Pedosphaera sp.]
MLNRTFSGVIVELAGDVLHFETGEECNSCVPNMFGKIKNNLALLLSICFFEQRMHSVRLFLSTRTSQGRGSWSVLFLALFLFLQTLALAPFLHQHWHADARQANHHCAVTILEEGKFQLSSVAVIAVLPATVVVETAPPIAPLLVSVEYQLLPGRAPPAFFSSLA